MDAQTFELVAFPFEQSRMDFEAARSGDLTITQYVDPQAFAKLMALARRLVSGVPNDFVLNVIESLNNSLQSAASSAKEGDMPPLNARYVDDVQARIFDIIARSPEQADGIVFAFIGAIFAETIKYFPEGSGLENSRQRTRVHFEMSSYEAWKAARNNALLPTGRLQMALDSFERESSHVLNNSLRHVEASNKRVIDLQDEEISLRSRLDGYLKDWDSFREQSTKDIERFEGLVARNGNIAAKIANDVALTQENLASFKAALIEEARGAETKKLWADRESSSWWALVLSSAVLGGLLLGVPLIGFLQLDVVIGTLKHIGDAATEGIPSDASGTVLTVATISRLVVITFPLVLYLWVVRLIVRFNTRSLVLLDDARQRQTMMETYFMLIEHGAASPEERGLILNALFRPAPGQGADNVDPPNFTEFLGKVVPGKA